MVDLHCSVIPLLLLCSGSIQSHCEDCNLPEWKSLQLGFWCVNFKSSDVIQQPPVSVDRFYLGSILALKTTLRPTCLKMPQQKPHRDLSYYFHMKEEKEEEVEMSYTLELSCCLCSFPSPYYLALAMTRNNCKSQRDNKCFCYFQRAKEPRRWITRYGIKEKQKTN